MQINWCRKGIAESGSFKDAEAADVLASTGILSNWIRTNGGTSAHQANISGQNALTASALDDHVNNYSKVAKDTPYISLSSGCYEYLGDSRPPLRRPALRTALNFATGGGKQSGYVFRCWVVTGLRPAAEVPGLAEEIRDINLFAAYYTYHRQGEITAKLVVPRRQVEWVRKYDKDLKPQPATWAGGGSQLDNTDFVPPHRISNLLEEIG